MKVYVVRAKEGIGIIYGVFEAREDAERYSGGADVAIEGYEVSPPAYRTRTQQIDKTDLEILTTVMGKTPDRTTDDYPHGHGEHACLTPWAETCQKAYTAEVKKYVAYLPHQCGPDCAFPRLAARRPTCCAIRSPEVSGHEHGPYKILRDDDGEKYWFCLTCAHVVQWTTTKDPARAGVWIVKAF